MQKTHANAVKAWIENGERKLLFLKEKSPLGKVYYSLPGGRLEQGESEEDGLKREVFEETGLKDVIVGKHLGDYGFTMDNGTKVEVKVFQCAIPKTAELRLEDGKAFGENISSFHWISAKEFLEKKFPSTDESFNAFLRKFH